MEGILRGEWCQEKGVVRELLEGQGGFGVVVELCVGKGFRVRMVSSWLPEGEEEGEGEGEGEGGEGVGGAAHCSPP